MGFNLNKAREKKEEIIKSFTPLDLNEGNVQAIFNRCLATDETNEYIESILQKKSDGYAQDSDPILFDKQKLLSNLKNIRYLYGQLLTTHKHTNTINTSVNGKTNVMTNYMGNTWIANKRYINAIFSFRSWF